MKKQQIKSLRLNKKSISNFTQNTIVGGTFVSCPGVGICPPTTQTVLPCSGNNCSPTGSIGCPTQFSCNDVDICPRR